MTPFWVGFKGEIQKIIFDPSNRTCKLCDETKYMYVDSILNLSEELV